MLEYLTVILSLQAKDHQLLRATARCFRRVSRQLQHSEVRPVGQVRHSASHTSASDDVPKPISISRTHCAKRWSHTVSDHRPYKKAHYLAHGTHSPSVVLQHLQ